MYPTQIHCQGGAGNRAWVEVIGTGMREKGGIWDSMTLSSSGQQSVTASFCGAVDLYQLKLILHCPLRGLRESMVCAQN